MRLLRTSVFFSAVALAACGGGGGGGGGNANGGDSGGTAKFTVGGTVSGLSGSLVLQNNLGDNLTVSGDGAFTFATALSSGSAYKVTLLSQQFPNQDCLVTGGTGNANANVTSVTVTCARFAAPRYLFAADAANYDLWTYLVDAVSGRLRFIGKTPIVAGASPIAMATDPTGKYVYLANQGGNSIVQYRVGADGSVSTMTPIEVKTGTTPEEIAVDPTGRYLYVVNSGSNDISQYTIGSDGALTAMTPATVAAGAKPSGITIDPSGTHLYVANFGDGDTDPGDISQYTIGDGGALTPLPGKNIAAGMSPVSLVIDPSGHHAYAANYGGHTVSQYTIGADGGLSPMTTPTVPAVNNPKRFAMDLSGRYLYVLNFNDASISQYTIGASGELSAMGTPKVATETGPQSITLDPSGKYIYVANTFGSSLSQYAIGNGGALQPLSVPRVPSGMFPMTSAVVAGRAAVKGKPKAVYAMNYSGNDVSQYGVGTDGTLAALSTPKVAAYYAPTMMAIDPSGKFAYVPNDCASGPNGWDPMGNPYPKWCAVSQYGIGTDGSLTPIAYVPTTLGAEGSNPRSVAVDPAGRFAYVANYMSGDVSQYTVGTNGALKAIGVRVPAGVAPVAVAVHPTGNYAYVLNQDSATISQFNIGTGGALSAMSPATVATGTVPNALVVHPSGRHAYVVESGYNKITRYDIGDTGALSSVSTMATRSGLGMTALALDPSAAHLYAVYTGTTAGDWGVLRYDIDSNGALSFAADQPTDLPLNTLAIDPSGQFVYATTGGDTIYQYAIGSNGALTSKGAAADKTGLTSGGIAAVGTWE